MDIKAIAQKYLTIRKIKNSSCKAGHEICLECEECHRKKGNIYSLQSDKDEMDLAPHIDHTLLKPDARSMPIVRLCHEARKYHFASVCVNPYFVSLAKREMHDQTVCAVIGFPLGANTTHVKLAECNRALDDGAKEIDMVINISEMKDGGYNYVYTEVAQIVECCHARSALLKVIIEACLLTDEEKIIACLLAKKAGADYVKTSTGFSHSGATVEDVALMRSVVGPYMGVKAAGGIRTRLQAENMIRAGADRLGASAGVSIVRSDFE